MVTKPRFRWVWAVGLLCLLAGKALGADYVNEGRTIAGPPQSAREQFKFTLGKDDPYPYFELTIQMSQGMAYLRVLDPAGKEVVSQGAQECTIVLQPIAGARTPGTYTVEVSTIGAVGHWQVRVCGGPTPTIVPGLASAGAMMLVAIASVWLCRRWSRAPWRWFWVGAALWTVAVAAKFGLAYLSNNALVNALQSRPPWVSLSVQTVYGGVLTGITEILFVFIAALIWRRMAATASRAVAIGVGTGAFEAALLAMAAIGIHVSNAGATDWSLVLVPATERAIVILCHTASRALVLLAVARRRWMLFVAGFTLLSGADAVATYLFVTGRISTLSPWLIEALLTPFGLLSIPIIWWCIRRWPAEAVQPAPHVVAPAESPTHA